MISHAETLAHLKLLRTEATEHLSNPRKFNRKTPIQKKNLADRLKLNIETMNTSIEAIERLANGQLPITPVEAGLIADALDFTADHLGSMTVTEKATHKYLALLLRRWLTYKEDAA